jgi:hypothetical protein
MMEAATMPRNMKEKPMSTQVSFQKPTQTDVGRLIAQAHKMRSDYISGLFKSGFARLRDVFPKSCGLGQASA